jgi:glycosyltransferase involved in cell wall biosynthesis
VALSNGTILIGLVARFGPVKDHGNFSQAANRLPGIKGNAYSVLLGRSVDNENTQITAAIQTSGHERRFHLLGEREDIPQIMAALDIATSFSASEGFQNTISEAMACGVPCVVTDAGDSSLLLFISRRHGKGGAD